MVKDTSIIKNSLVRLESWLVSRKYSSYDPFDGLSSVFRPLTMENRFLRVLLQQSIRQFPFNLRKYVGVKKSRSSKGMGYIIKGYSSQYLLTKDINKLETAISILAWLVKNSNKKYSGVSWGNHFDYQSGLFYLPKGEPTVVWTALIGHSIIDLYESSNNSYCRPLIESICNFITKDLDRYKDEKGICISYITEESKQVHNSNLLAASFLARAAVHVDDKSLVPLAKQCIDYGIGHINDDYSWFYAVNSKQHWIDSFHTGYNLDSIKYYMDYSGDYGHLPVLKKAYNFFIESFFENNTVPKYYHNRTYPIDIQCCSQSIETLVKLKDYNSNSLDIAYNVALWTIENMQDPTGYFYFRKYPGFYNKTETLHWGQATMFSALSSLLLALNEYQ